MTHTKQTTDGIRGVALFGMPYLYQSNNIDFHMAMVYLGLLRDTPCLCGLPHKAILADAAHYWLDDYADEATLCDTFGFVPTYTVEDFVSEIKKMKGYEE